MTLRTWLFLRKHKRSCNRTIASARELSRVGHEKRRRAIKTVARQIREELGLAPDPRLT